METKLIFTNRTKRPTSNYILIFLQPVEPQDNYLYSCWDYLNPSIGSTQTTTLRNSFSAYVEVFGDARQSTSATAELELGKVYPVVNPHNQSPFIDTLPTGGLVTPRQVGLLNATTPAQPLMVNWLVNNKRVVQTNNTAATTLNKNFTSTFELKQSVYLMLGQRPQITQTYVAQTFGQTQEFRVPSDAREMHFEVYTDEQGVDRFQLIRQSLAARLEERQAELQSLLDGIKAA